MKKGIYILLATLMVLGKSQLATAQKHLTNGSARSANSVAPYNVHLAINNVDARFASDGLFSNDDTLSLLVPNNNPQHFGTLYAGNLWFSGIDNYGQLKAAYQTYRNSDQVYTPGPLDVNGNMVDSINFNYIWRVNQADLNSFLTDLNDNGVINNPIPASIYNWPGKGNTHAKGAGNTTFTVTTDAAPFVDYNNDGVYRPEDGDYPAIMGDEAVWWVINDNTRANGRLPMGIQVGIMAYEYNRMPFDSVINNTVFFSVDVLNRSGNNYNTLRAGVWSDMDVACPYSDYQGCDTACNYYFTYSGVLVDTGCVTNIDTTQPVQVMQFLDDPMYAFIPIYNDPSEPTGQPFTSYDARNFLSALYKDNSPIIYGCISGTGSHITRYAYSGNPSDTTQQNRNNNWTEINCGDFAEDRMGIGSIGPFNLNANTTKHFSFAYTTHPNVGGNYHVNTDKLCQKQSYVQSFFDLQNIYSGIHETDNAGASISLYPNPNSGSFRVEFGAKNLNGTNLTIFDMLGRSVYETQPTSNSITVSLPEKGIYLLRFTANGQTTTKKVVVQ